MGNAKLANATANRVEMMKLLTKLRRGDEKPGHTTLRALRCASDLDDLLTALKHVVEALAINRADIKPGLAIYLNDICRTAILKATSETQTEYERRAAHVS